MQNKEMNQDTIKLLSEINSGCKMAIDSMEQIGESVDDKRLEDITKKYIAEHMEIENRTHELLNEAGAPDQEPGLVAKVFASMQAKIKMMMKNDVHQAASLLTDGCNMGIKSLCEYKNSYKAADTKSVELFQKLCDIENGMMKELQPLL